MDNLNKEARIILALQALKEDSKLTLRKAARIYTVPKATLSDRKHGKTSRRDSMANSRILTELEEDVIVKYILELDLQGFPPKLSEVEDMANRIRRERDASSVGTRWTQRFITRHEELKTRLSRRYDYSRAQCEDPKLISGWFKLVENTMAKYGIVFDDIWNFDETGFLLGHISTTMVVTSSERRSRPKKKQPGNREWATAIECISCAGVAIPPFIILGGKCHLSSWYENSPLPRDWVIATSPNGWTTNQLGMDWIQHFHRSTVASKKGGYRLLLVDGHESHHSVDFELYCRENNIITLCMPPHSSHLLQPLDVGCFSPLKRAYGGQVEGLMRARRTHVSKEDFLPAFHTAHNAVFTKENIQGAFRGAGIYPLDAQAVISKLDLRLETPTLPSPRPRSAGSSTTKTPSNARDVTSQSTKLKTRILNHRSSSPTDILAAIDRVAKGMTQVVTKYTLQQREIAELRKANEELSKRRRAKKTRLREGGSLSLQGGQALNDSKDVEQQILAEVSSRRGRREDGPSTLRHCSNCGATGHNMRTCQVDVEMSEEDDSE